MKINETKLKLWKNSSTTVVSMFEGTVKDFPNVVALKCNNITYTYSELNTLTDNLAYYLQKKGVVKNAVVGIYLDKSPEYIIACLSILKAGGAYLHIDTEYNPEIIKKVIDDTHPILVITRKSFSIDFGIYGTYPIYVEDNDTWNPDNQPLSKIDSLTQDDAAFIGYTSGTTGIPKGVVVSHLSAVYSMSKFWEEVNEFGDIDIYGYATYLSWDALSPLLFGGTSYIIPDLICQSSPQLVNYIFENKINHTFFTPSLIVNILETVDEKEIKEKLSGVRVIWVGGEVVTGDLLKKIKSLLPNTHILNNYGPSECFVVTQGELTANDVTYQLCPAGAVLPEMDVKVLDSKMQTVQKYEKGELYVKGPCLATGYVNNTQLTNSKFIDIKGEIYFRTGDIASYTDDGRLIIHGRADYFKNVKGVEVNVLELQQKICQLLSLDYCIFDVDSRNGEEITVLFYPESKMDAEEMKFILQQALPNGLVPTQYRHITSIPMSPTSQKLDRKNLFNKK